MKIALVLLVLLPLAFAKLQPDKRAFISDVVDLEPLRRIVLDILLQLGSDPTEQQCETTCHQTIATEESTLHYGCDLVCLSFQELVQLLYPDSLTAAP